jgi:hypothetical protein
MKWKHSKLRFYILNTLWNYKFWIFAEKMFKEHTYYVTEENFDLSDVDALTGKMKHKRIRKVRRRFIGYMYKSMIHLDNPGFRHTVDEESWKAWKSKGLIK